MTPANMRDGYVSVCRTVLRQGYEVGVRGQRTREVTGVTLILPYAAAPMLPIGVGRGVNTKLAAVEALCMIGGVWNDELVRLAAPRYHDVLVNPKAAEDSAYGPRVVSQLALVESMLTHDPTTRQAVVTIWDRHDLYREGTDLPCTLTLQFLLRHDQLECHVTMRSQDVWLGLAMDVFVFTQVQHTLARSLRVRPGRYVHHVGSLHAYERDWHGIERLRRPDGDPREPLPLGVVGPGSQRHALALLDGEHQLQNSWYSDRIGELLFRKVEDVSLP